MSRSLLDQFPLRPTKKKETVQQKQASETESIQKLRSVTSASKFSSPIPDNDPGALQQDESLLFKRPGSRYKRHRNEVELGPDMHALLATAAKLIGVQLRTLMEAVFMCERKLADWKNQNDKSRDRAAEGSRRPRKGPEVTITPASGASEEDDDSNSAGDEMQLDLADRLDDGQMVM